MIRFPRLHFCAFIGASIGDTPPGACCALPAFFCLRVRHLRCVSWSEVVPGSSHVCKIPVASLSSGLLTIITNDHLSGRSEMKRILKTGVRRMLRNLFGPGVEAFVVDDDWQALLFVPDSR